MKRGEGCILLITLGCLTLTLWILAIAFLVSAL